MTRSDWLKVLAIIVPVAVVCLVTPSKLVQEVGMVFAAAILTGLGLYSMLRFVRFCDRVKQSMYEATHEE